MCLQPSFQTRSRNRVGKMVAPPFGSIIRRLRIATTRHDRLQAASPLQRAAHRHKAKSTCLISSRHQARQRRLLHPGRCEDRGELRTLSRRQRGSGGLGHRGHLGDQRLHLGCRQQIVAVRRADFLDLVLAALVPILDRQLVAGADDRDWTDQSSIDTQSPLCA